jgi:hypothetical protein
MLIVIETILRLPAKQGIKCGLMSIRPRPVRRISRELARNKALNRRSPKGDFTTRFMVLVKATPESEKQGALPDPQLLLEMGKYNEELMQAGVLLALDGLHPSSKGARVKFSGKSRTVIDGPFTEAKELIAGFSILPIRWPLRGT